MIRRVTVLLLLLGAGRVPAQGGQDPAAIQHQLARYTSFVVRMLPDSIGALFSEHGVLDAAGRGPVVGPAAVASYLREFAGFHVLADSMVADSLEITGTSARQVGRFWQRVVVPAGDTVLPHGLFVIAWIRGADGQWRIQRMGTR